MVDAIFDSKVLYLVLIVCLLYTLFTAYLCYGLAKTMSGFTFSQAEFQEFLISQHSILVRGINQQIGVAEAKQAVTKVFENWFGRKLIANVVVPRPVENLTTLYRKQRDYKYKLDKV